MTLHPLTVASIEADPKHQTREDGCYQTRNTGSGWSLCPFHLGMQRMADAVADDLAIAERAKALQPRRARGLMAFSSHVDAWDDGWDAARAAVLGEGT